MNYFNFFINIKATSTKFPKLFRAKKTTKPFVVYLSIQIYVHQFFSFLGSIQALRYIFSNRIIIQIKL